ncbi:MAG: helix-turn-helix transcriptional regulator [Ruminiclostridium sp.]|nr:helix-turn-helix transcriptional regulator [Ruminiclostridium sp.]
MENRQMQFSENLQNLRKEKGLSQEELGEQLSVSRQTISKWEKGTAYPDMLNLMTISQFFGISADELISGRKEENATEEAEERLQEEAEASVDSSKAPPFHLEYESRIKIKNLPLVHVNCGFGGYKAKGVIAVGNFATGIFSVGLISKGLISIGVLSLGLIAFGVLALGLVSVCCIGAGIIAIAGIGVGVMNLSGVGFGVVSVAGCAFSTHVSIGGVAYAPVAVGYVVKGDETMLLQNLSDISVTESESVLALINAKFPDFPEILKFWATMIFK